MQNIQKQISRSTSEIGFEETVFHITSQIVEILSGVLADVFGRKNMLVYDRFVTACRDFVLLLVNSVGLFVPIHADSHFE